jgi:type II secretory pathway pseudopilin PulG
MMTPQPSRRQRRQAGFTIVELTISLIVIVEVLLAVLMLFDFSNKVSHVQSNIADMQQSLRIAQNEMNALVRTAGRGGLNFLNTSPGGGMWVRDNVNTTATIGDATSPAVLAGTDVLTVRGVFATPIYQVNYQDSTSLEYRDAANVVTTDPALAQTGTLRVPAQTTPDGMTLQPLADAVANNIHEALIIQDASNADIHAVVELLPGSSSVTVTGQALLNFKVRGVAGDTVTSYMSLIPGGTFPRITSVSAVGILEEWRFYIRKNVTAADLAPKLTKARFMPGTDVAYGPPPGPGVDNTPNLSIDLADDILDLQISLALDTPNHVVRAAVPGLPPEPAGLTTIAADNVNGYLSEAADGLNDDWLFNNTNDNVADGIWANTTLYYARISLLARTDRRDPKYQAPVITKIEDHTYTATDPLNLANTATGSTQQRMYRRRILQTVIDVRNM